MAKTGERKAQILQTLAAMLEDPKGERVTTALLAARLEVSEAALYRHFSSKAQMFEGLIEFIEQSVFTLINQIAEREAPGPSQAGRIVAMLIQFAEKNPGMTRVMVGDALVFENERLQARMNQFFDRIESQLRQGLRARAEAGEADDGALWRGAQHLSSPTRLPGFPTRAQVAAAYAAGSGLDLEPLPWYVAFGTFKLAVVLAGILARVHAGMVPASMADGLDGAVDPLVALGEHVLAHGLGAGDR